MDYDIDYFLENNDRKKTGDADKASAPRGRPARRPLQKKTDASRPALSRSSADRTAGTRTAADREPDGSRAASERPAYRQTSANRPILTRPSEDPTAGNRSAADRPSERESAAKRAAKKEAARIRLLSVICAGGLLLVMSVISMILPLRPTESQREKRKLAEFPAFSVKTLFSGDYFADIGTWYSDTMPGRDTLISINSFLQNILGTATVQSGFNEAVRNEIPDAPAAQPATLPAEPETDAPASEETTAGYEEVTDDPNAPAPIVQKFNGVFVVDGAAYEYYDFVQESADNYAAAINTTAAKLSGKATVYGLVIPTSTGIIPPKKVRDENSDDQQKAISYIESALSPEVKRVSIYEPLMAHRDEYIYFRTDHHWTALGAYYAYEAFCGVKGVTPVALEACEKKTFDGFLGTFYNETGGNPELARNPDVVDAYTPPGEYSMDIPGEGLYGIDMIYDESFSSANLKYSAFIWGDNPLTIIEDKAKETGESCLVVKESFGNALVPFIAANYKYVYVMDYRYGSESIVSLVNEKGIDDVIFANNISMTRSADLIRTMINRIG